MSSKKTRILLLSVNSNTFYYDQVVIPFGLISLASYVGEEDYEIKGIEMNSPPEKIKDRYLKVDKNLLNEIKTFSPDIVAMSTYSSNIYNVLFWVNVIKKILPNCLTIIGGNHASYIARECLEKYPSLDMIVSFEGEIPFKAICEKVKSDNQDFSDVPSLTYRLNGKIKENAQIDFIKDLNQLPYLNRRFFQDPTKKDEEIYHADLITARGCPFNCTFCNCNHYWSKVYRVRLMDSVITELKQLKEKFPNLKSVRIRDESVTINRHRCAKLCDALEKNNVNLEFQAHSRLDGLDEEVIQNLARAGFKLVFIGMESGSSKVLERLQKGIDISRAEEVVALLRKYGIGFRVSFMSFTPGEKLKETLKTIRLIKKLKLRKNEFYLGSGIAIYPGTTECDNFLKLNLDYEWLAKEYPFRGKYSGAKDQNGNILHPYYQEHGRLKTILLKIFLQFALEDISGRFIFLKKLLSRVKNKILQRFSSL